MVLVLTMRLKRCCQKLDLDFISIYERMDDVGGSLKIESETDKACKAILTAPLNVGQTDRQR